MSFDPTLAHSSCGDHSIFLTTKARRYQRCFDHYLHGLRALVAPLSFRQSGGGVSRPCKEDTRAEGRYLDSDGSGICHLMGSDVCVHVAQERKGFPKDVCAASIQHVGAGSGPGWARDVRDSKRSRVSRGLH